MLSIILQTVNENWNLIWGIDSPNWDMHESGKGNCLVVRGGTWYRKLKTIGMFSSRALHVTTWQQEWRSVEFHGYTQLTEETMFLNNLSIVLVFYIFYKKN
jgi:hypothetical protein